MNRRAKIAAVALSVAISGAGGYWFGVRQGMELAIWADSVPRGVIATGAHGTFAGGNSDRLKILFESDIDGGLLSLYYLDNSPFRNLMHPIWGLPKFSVYADYGARLANYRKLNPSPFQYENPGIIPEVKEANPELYQEMLQNGKATARALTESINRYSTKP